MILAKNKEYLQLLNGIKAKVRTAQITAISVNKELIDLYGDIATI